MITPSKTISATFPYKIEEKIGAGGMGIVYRAIEPALNRKVAIKVLRTQVFDEEPPEVADEYRRRFMQEARAAAALSHPGATTIYRIGEEDGVPFIAMEWLDGPTLEAVLTDDGPLPLERVARLGVELLETLEAAHRAGVVHRDIKPSNLIILNDGRLKVTDFGIARVQNSDLVKTGTGTVLATPQFASPEQLQGDDVDGRSDVYSAGVVLYLAFTGRFPFEGRNYFDLVAALARSEAPSIRKYLPGVPEGFEKAVMSAIRREPDERHASAAAFAAALRPFTTGAVEASISSELTKDLPPQRAAETVRNAPLASYPTVTDVPHEAQYAVVRVVESWPSRSIGTASTSTILARLLERPLHAPPFAGGVFLGGYCLLIYGGCIVGAVDANMRSCDEVCDELPDSAPAVLHAVPEGMSPNLVPLLATLLHPPKVRHAHLDTSLVNLPALATRLSEEKFEGVLRLDRGGPNAFLFFDAGAPALALFSHGWEDLPISTTWDSWMSRVPISASLEEKVWIPAHLSYRKELKDFGFYVAPQAAASAGARLKQTFLKKTSGLSSPSQASAARLTPMARPTAPDDIAAMEAFYSGDPAYRFLEWAVAELPGYFQERDRTAKWKYLVEWIPLVRRAMLHHTLPRPDQWEADFFDLVTFDSADKVLHIAHRVPRGTPEALKDFVDRVIQAKKARTKTGDVGGAFLIAPQFEESMIEAYQASTKPTGTGILSVEEKLTKYEGFIRMGPRRGFHLLLVAEKPDGFEPLLLV